jgi:hypothetical protein
MRFKLIKKILFLGAVLPLCVFASLVKAYEVRDFVYELHGNKAKITDYVGTQTTITIPSYLDGFEVTVIGQNALNNKGLSSVSLPSTLLIVEDSAFANNFIATINFPPSVLEVKSNAFMNNRIQILNLPSTLKVVGESAFSQNRLRTINYDHQETQVEMTAFETDTGYLQSYRHGNYLNVFYQTINNEIHIWGDDSNCDSNTSPDNWIRAEVSGKPVVAIHRVNLTNNYHCSDIVLHIPDTVRYIGKYAFSSGVDLSSLFFGESVETIADYAFSGLELNSVTIPNSVKHIGNSAFENNKLTSLTIPGSVKHIGEKAFFQNKLHTLELGYGAETIGNSAFQNNKITSLTIRAGVKTIGDYAFKSNYISELNFEQSQADIGVEAFRDNHISQVTIPETIGEIASDAFYGNQITDVNYLGGGAEFYFIGDSDQDGVFDVTDAFPFDASETADFDGDGIGNNTDTDDDNDGYTDFLDAFPSDVSEWADSDLDGIGNNSDPDDDNDGVADTEDAFPHTASESLDSDNDGVGDNSDAFPNDATEVADTDLDGIGNNADPDDDNDGVADADDGDPLNADIGIQPSQLISVSGNPVGVNGHSTRIRLSYNTSDGNTQLPGIGFRLHYSSEMLSFAGTENTIANDIIVDGDGPYQDDSDFDNDTSTDKYIIFGWAALNGDWPNSSLPASLVDVVFNVSWEAFDQASINTPINFSKVSATEGYNFEATNYTLNVLPATWDFDGNGQADALTDGLIFLRHAFGVRGASLTDSVMATDSTMTSNEVQVAVEKAQVIADIDGDGNVDALTDGLILLRYMFDIRTENLVDDVVSANATRASAESVQQHIELYMPNNLLPPVQSEQSFIVGDWKLASMPEHREYGENGLTNWGNLPSWRGLTQTVFETCMADDIYRFDDYGAFEYLFNGSTFIDFELNPMGNYDYNLSNCVSPFAPWNENEVYTYSIDENNSLLTVIGRGAFIALAHVANGTDDIENAADAPQSVSYDFTKLSETEVLLEIDAYDDLYRFTLQKVVN